MNMNNGDYNPNSAAATALIEFVSRGENELELVTSIAYLYATNKEAYNLFKQGMSVFEPIMDLIKNGYVYEQNPRDCEFIRDFMTVPQNADLIISIRSQ